MLLDTKLLRQKVLDLAIRGQLVPQLDSDEPAIHIIERICKMRNTKPTKLLSAPIEYDLPKGWVQSCIGDLFKLQSGKFIKGSEINDSISSNAPYACYGGNGIRGYVSTFNRDGAYPLLGRVGALCGNIKLAKGKFYATDNVTVVDHFNELDDKWVCYAFETLNLKQYANATAQPCISSGNLKNVPIYIPPLEEQKRIVAKVEEIFAELDAIDKAYSELDQLGTLSKSKILDLAIKGQLVPQLESEPTVAQLGKAPEDVPFDIPEKWKWCNLKDLIKLKSGRDLNKDLILEQNTNNTCIPYLTGASQISEGRLILNRFTSSPSVISHKGELLITCKGTIGKLAFNNVGDLHIARQIMSFCNNHETLLLNYLYLYLLNICNDLKNEANGIIPGISRQNILSKLIPLPPLEEQKRIVAKVEELFALIDAMKK